MSPPLPRGITLLDLVTAVPQSLHETMPSALARFLEHLSVVESRSRASGGFDIMEGTVRAAVELVGIDVGDGFIAELPGLSEGIGFTFASGRPAPTVIPAIEPAPVFWQVSLHVDRLMVPMPGSAAVVAEAQPGYVGPLVDDPERDRVHLWVRGTIQIDNNGGIGPVRPSIVSDPDPFVPNAPSGRVITAGLEPPHVMFGNSGFGLTMGDVVLDQTIAFTPPEIIARGHDAAWRGLSVSEATLHLPRDLPFLGDVVAGVRDLLIGFEPDNGVQLEAFLQLGETSRLDTTDAAHKVTIHVYQDVDGQLVELTPQSGPAVQREIPVDTVTNTDPVRVTARLSPPDAEARWRLPGTTTWITGNETPWMTVQPGDPRATLGYRDIFTLEDDSEADGPKITFAFVADEPTSDTDKYPPTIDLTVDPFTGAGPFHWRNVTHVAGTPDDVLGIEFTAAQPLPNDPTDEDRFTWSLEHAGSTVTGTGRSFNPDVFGWADGRHELVLTDHRDRRRRLLIDVAADLERMTIGCATNDSGQAGPRLLIDQAQEEAAVPTSIVGSFHLRRFHQDGMFDPAIETATGTGQPMELTVPAGTLAEVTLDHPDDVASKVVSAFRVLMDFDATDPIAYRRIHPDSVTTDQENFEGSPVAPWGPADPYPTWVDGSNPEQGGDSRYGLAVGAGPDDDAAIHLRSWADEVLAVDSTAQFVIIGRTCDIGDVNYNATLGGDRAAHGLKLLTDPSLSGTPVHTDKVYHRGENLDEIPTNGTLPPDPTVFGQLDDPDHTDRSLASRTAKHMRIAIHFAEHFDSWGQAREIEERKEARSFDVYAVATVSDRSSPSERDAATRRRTLVPGADLWAAITEQPSEKELTWALRLLARWDSPSWVDAQDSAPTLVELAFDWENATLEIPEIPDGPGAGSVDLEPTVDPAPGDSKVWQVILRFAHDPLTRQMVISGALDTPGNDEGIARIAESDQGGSGLASDVALALALGPALATGADTIDEDSSVVSLAALLVTATASAIFNIARDGVTTLHRLEFGYGRAAGGADTSAPHRIWLYADYTAAFTALVGSDDNPILEGRDVEIRYRRAGIEMGASTNPFHLESVGIVYEEAAEIVSPGDWSLNTGLAKLLGIEAVRMGAGSIWIEIDLALAISLGPITLDRATLRLILDSGSFELRGLTLTIEIPGVLTGSGSLAITENDGSTVISAAIGLAIEPIGLGIDASLCYDDPMLHLEVAVTFATPIPILGTGLGLFGLNGRFVSNGTRDIPPFDDETDPVQRELDWLANPDKYRKEPGQTAIGIGATIGTQADSGFTFNLTGMLTIEFPDPSVVLTVAGEFLTTPEKEAAETDDVGGGLLGIISVSSDGLAVGIRGTYGVPGLLDVNIPVSAWFPFTSVGGDAYVRIGSDGFGGRNGDPVTVTILPGTLDLQAWSYLMIEAKEMSDLGGYEDFDFTGFSVGFGAGYDFEWGGSVVYLRAGSSIVIGLGTDPFFIRGILEVGGEMRLGPVGVGIDGIIDLTVADNPAPMDDAALDGTFEAEVDLAFFSMSGKVSISIGNVPEPPVPPPPLVSEMSLTDRHARIVATAVKGPGTPGDANTAWPDCRPTLHFSKRVIDALDGDSFRPTPAGGWGADWAGSARAKFVYRLKAVELLDAAGTAIADAPDWPSVWWLPAGRPAIPVEGDAPSSEHESWDLSLLAWDLAPWARAMLDGGESADGDLATVIERLCDPLPETHKHCVFGAAGQRIDATRVRFSAGSQAPLPWRATASLSGLETLGVDPDATEVWAAMLGYRPNPSRVVRLPEPWLDAETDAGIARGWLLPTYEHPTAEPVTLGLDADWSAEVSDPDLVVAIVYELPVNGSEFELHLGLDEFGDDPPETMDYGLAQVTGHTDAESLEMFDWSMALQFRELEIDIGTTLGSVTFGPANRVEARVGYIGVRPVLMAAYDAAGVELARALPPANVARNEAYRLVINAQDIASVRLFSEPAVLLDTLFLDDFRTQMPVSYGPEAMDSLIESFEENGAILAPPCYGKDGAEERLWDAELLDVVADERRVAAIVRYAPSPDDVGPWRGLRLDPTLTIGVVILRSCFMVTSAVEAAEAADAARDDIINEWEPVMSSKEERVVLLEPGQEYSVRVTYDVASWNQTDDGTAPPPAVSSLDWSEPSGDPETVDYQFGLTQEFSFQTADEASIDDADLLRFDVQHRFDPRAVARYLVGFDPASTPPRHFLDDKLLVHFEVEWVADLLESYGYELSLDVARTDPPPGTSTGFDDRLVASTIGWSSATSTMQASQADARAAVAALLMAAQSPPCVPGPIPQGITACIEAELEPYASYDLVVRAVPLAGFGPAVDIARTNFTTSAYHNADELYNALGLDSNPGAGPNTVYPFEQIVVSSEPIEPVLADDVALDEALTDLGLDPLPLPDEPTLQLLWIDDGGWKVAGLLIDSTEAVERAARLEDVLDDSPPGEPTMSQAALVDRDTTWVAVLTTDPVTGEEKVVDYIEAPLRLALPTAGLGGVSLIPRRSNGSATRVLLAPQAPITPDAGALLTVEWSDRGLARDATVHVPPVPRLVSQELT